MKKKSTAGKLIIDFGSTKAARHFKEWLDGSGEQDYWNWMADREDEEKGPITATKFLYTKSNIVKVELGRLEEE